MSALEDLLAEQLRVEGIEFTREYKFLPDRRFRADFMLPAFHVLVEVQGGLAQDYEKSNLAQFAGWRYLQFTAEDVTSWRAVDTIICNSRWYAVLDARLIEDYRKLGLEQAAERAGLCAEYAKNLLVHYGAIERPRVFYELCRWRRNE